MKVKFFGIVIIVILFIAICFEINSKKDAVVERKLHFEKLEKRDLLTRTMPDASTIWQTPDHGEWYESNPTYTDNYNDDVDWNFSLNPFPNPPTNNQTQSVIVVVGNTIVYEQYFNGGSKTDANNIHSASKSIISALVDIAIDEGLISSKNTLVNSILDDNNIPNNLTVGNLLDMSSGLNWTEDGSEYNFDSGDDWVQGIFNLGTYTQPGNSFHYSTGNSHLVSAILQEATGVSTPDYFHSHLGVQLNINAEHWGRDPQAVYSGGYNVYMTPREMAKFGVWARDNYNFSKEGNPVSYYDDFWWRNQISGDGTNADATAWGWGGQFIIIEPEYDLVVVSTTDTSGFVNDSSNPPIFDWVSDDVIPNLPTIEEPYLDAISDQNGVVGIDLAIQLNTNLETITLSTEAFDLDQTYNFYANQTVVDNEYYYDNRGLGEKFFFGGSDWHWYFILPSGDIYEYGGESPDIVSAGNYVGSIDPWFHVDPQRLLEVNLPEWGFNSEILSIKPFHPGIMTVYLGPVVRSFDIDSILVSGDVNSDGVVNGLDVNIISLNWLLVGASYENGDLNGDGIVNGLDANIVSSNWQG